MKCEKVTAIAPRIASEVPARRRDAFVRMLDEAPHVHFRKSNVRAMFMFNTFESIEPLREAACLERRQIHPQARAGTTSTDAKSADVFRAAGIPSVDDAFMLVALWAMSHADDPRDPPRMIT